MIYFVCGNIYQRFTKFWILPIDSSLIITGGKRMKKFLSALLVLLTVAVMADNAALNSEKSGKSDQITPVVKPVEPAFFSPPVCIYAGRQSFFWGYRVSRDFIDPKFIPEKIICSIPELSITASADVQRNQHRQEWARLPKPVVPGKYKVIMKALGKNGKVLLEKSFTLVVINRPEYGKNFPIKTVSVDPEGNILVNGRKTLINGVYNAFHSNGAKNIAYAGFNTAKVRIENPDGCQKILKILESNKIYADCEFKNITGKKLTSLIKSIKNNPAFLSRNTNGKPSQVVLKICPDELDKVQRPQTAAQIRSNAYAALIDGAKELWWDNFPEAYRIPHLWGAVTLFNSELFELEDVITGKLTPLDCSNKAVKAAVFSNGSRTVVIAVNSRKNEVKTVLNGIPGKTLTELFSDKFSVPVSGGKVKITIAPEGTCIFEVK